MLSLIEVCCYSTYIWHYVVAESLSSVDLSSGDEELCDIS